MPARESPARRDTQSGHAPLQDSPPTAAQSLTRREWLFLAALVLAIFFVYQPAWQGGILWDDDAHLTRPDLRSWQGLYRIWFELDATAQYYPVLHSAFWIEHRMWGDATLGYHLANILFHAVAACLAALILRRLAIPGALLAAAVFALHPVQAESVAWISEQKNTLSAVFYLGAMLVYLRFDQTRKRWLYGCALDLFLLAVLSKTVTATLPGALLVIFWWQRGRLSWRKDVLPLVPFFLLGAGGGLITAWWELKINNCVGPEFQFTLVERLLIAGRAIWFHLGKLCWPATLTFLYPRWQIDSAAWWQYLFPLGVTALLAGCWSIRRRTRAPLAALLFFAGTLFPVLGFFNLYTFRYSLVANHYQYLASLGPFTLAAAGAAWLFARWPLWPRRAGYAVCLAALAVLAGMTWRQSHMYADSETLYAQTIAENPDCWLAHNNLGLALAGRGEDDEALQHYRKALEINPDYVEAHVNLAVALTGRGRDDEVLQHYRKALRIKPGFAKAHNNLGVILAGRGEVDEAIRHYEKALEIEPDYVEAHSNLSNALAARGQVDLAIAHYQKALETCPNFAGAHYNLAILLAGRGQVDLAITHYQKALEAKPDYAEAHCNLGSALLSCGELDSAIAHCKKALEIKPDFAEAHCNLGGALFGRGEVDSAIAHYQKALRIRPDLAQARHNLDVILAERERIRENLAQQREALRLQPNDTALLNNIAWMLATNPNASVRNGADAVELTERALKLSGGNQPAILDTLAAAYAEVGRFSAAVATARKALDLATQQNKRSLADALQKRIALYGTGKPYRQTRSRSAPASTNPKP